MTAADDRSRVSLALEDALQSLFGGTGLQLVPEDLSSRTVVENGTGLLRLHTRCRAAVVDVPAGAAVIVVIAAEQRGLLRPARWILLPFQVAIASRAMLGRLTLLGRFAVFPNLHERSVLYEMRSPAQRYAERLLIPRLPAGTIVRTVRTLLAAWAGCDPAVGAVVLVGAKL